MPMASFGIEKKKPCRGNKVSLVQSYDTDLVIGRNGHISAEGYTFPFKGINGETTGRSNRLLIGGRLLVVK